MTTQNLPRQATDLRAVQAQVATEKERRTHAKPWDGVTIVYDDLPVINDERNTQLEGLKMPGGFMLVEADNSQHAVALYIEVSPQGFKLLALTDAGRLYSRYFNKGGNNGEDVYTGWYDHFLVRGMSIAGLQQMAKQGGQIDLPNGKRETLCVGGGRFYIPNSLPKKN